MTENEVICLDDTDKEVDLTEDDVQMLDPNDDIIEVDKLDEMNDKHRNNGKDQQQHKQNDVKGEETNNHQSKCSKDEENDHQEDKTNKHQGKCSKDEENDHQEDKTNNHQGKCSKDEENDHQEDKTNKHQGKYSKDEENDHRKDNKDQDKNKDQGDNKDPEDNKNQEDNKDQKDNKEENKDQPMTTVTSEYNCKQFYESHYNQLDDDRCFERINLTATELCDKLNESQKNSKQFQFVIKEIKAKKMRSFIDKFRSTDMFLIYFDLKTLPGKTKKSKPITDLRVRPGFLDNIEKICILLGGDQTINWFKTKDAIQAFKDELYTHGLEFENESVTAICFDVKLTYKIFKSCFEIDDDNLNKIIWHDPKVSLFASN